MDYKNLWVDRVRKRYVKLIYIKESFVICVFWGFYVGVSRDDYFYFS